MISIEYYRNFMTAVRCGSISNAAKSLFMSQSSLSRQIQAIERELEIPLLNRKGRAVSLTPGGQVLYDCIPELLSRYESLKAEIQRASLNTEKWLRIGVLEEQDVSDILPTAIGRFRKNYPEIQLSLERLSARGLIEQLCSNKLDIIYTYAQTLGNRSDLRIKHIQTSNIVAMLNRFHALASREKIYLTDLQSESIVLSSDCIENAYGDNLLLKVREAHVNIDDVDKGENLSLRVESGLVVALVDSRTVIRHNPQVVVKKLADFEAKTCSLVIAWAKDNTDPVVEAFAKMIPMSLKS